MVSVKELTKLSKKGDFWLQIAYDDETVYLRASEIEAVFVTWGDRFRVVAQMRSGKTYCVAHATTMKEAESMASSLLKVLSSPKEVQCATVDLEDVSEYGD